MKNPVSVMPGLTRHLSNTLIIRYRIVATRRPV
jgi:hypothetical protein